MLHPQTTPLASVIAGVHAAGGFFLAANASPSELLVAAPDVGRLVQGVLNNQRPTLIETSSRIAIEGRTRAVVEHGPGRQRKLGINELATQNTEPRREFLVLTEMGMSFVVRNRPIDTLVTLFESGGSRDQEIRAFFERCACSVGLAFIYKLTYIVQLRL
jgi:nuclear pore complex protein Nup155